MCSTFQNSHSQILLNCKRLIHNTLITLDTNLYVHVLNLFLLQCPVISIDKGPCTNIIALSDIHTA